MSIQTDTIAAIATPAGPGAIGILRLSGPRAAEIAAACFCPLGRRGCWTIRCAPWCMGTCWTGRGSPLTGCCAPTAAAPPAIQGRTRRRSTATAPPWCSPLGLEALFAQGARQAGPGEFTQRAFLHGRMDLAQAEAGGRSAGRPEPGGGAPCGGAALRGAQPADSEHLQRPGGPDGPFPRGAGLPG